MFFEKSLALGIKDTKRFIRFPKIPWGSSSSREFCIFSLSKLYKQVIASFNNPTSIFLASYTPFILLRLKW